MKRMKNEEEWRETVNIHLAKGKNTWKLDIKYAEKDAWDEMGKEHVLLCVIYTDGLINMY